MSFNRNYYKSKSDTSSVYSDASDRTYNTSRSDQSKSSPRQFVSQEKIKYTKNSQGDWRNASGKSSSANSPNWRTNSKVNSETSSFYSETTGTTSVSNASKTTGSSQKKFPPIQSQIKDWASTEGSDEDKITEYNLKCTIFDNPNFQRTNFINFTGYLSKYRRLNLLEWYLNNKIPSLIESMIEEEEKKNKEESVQKNISMTYVPDKKANFVRESLKAYSPINQAIWPTKDTIYTSQVITEIKGIINLLASHNFSYISRKQRKDGSEYEESVIDALYDEENPIPLEFKNEIFDYLMFEFDNENFWIHPYNSKVNKICKNLTEIDKKVVDLIYMVGMRCTKTIVKRQFCDLVGSKSAITIDENSLNNLHLNIFELWLNPPPFSQSIYSRFYEDKRSNLESKPLEIADYIVTNGKQTVDKLISKLEYDPDLSKSDLITIKSKDKSSHFKNFFFLLGMLYSRGFYKQRIINLIDSILDESDGPSLVMTSIIHFLLGGRIDLNGMDLELREFFAKFFGNIYNLEKKKGIDGFGIFDANLIFRFLNYKGNPHTIYCNLLIPEVQIKYTGKTSPVIKFKPIADDYVLESKSTIQKRIEDLNSKPIIDTEIAELENIIEQMILDDLELVDAVESEFDEFDFDEVSDMIKPNELLVEIFVRFIDYGELDDANDFINRKLTDLAKTDLNQELVIAIISSLNLRQKPNHIQRIKDFIGQTSTPQSLIQIINEVMNTQSIIQSFKNDHDFPNIEKIVRQIM